MVGFAMVVARNSGAGECVGRVLGGRDRRQVAPDGPDRFINRARQSVAIDQALHNADCGIVGQIVSPACL